MVQNSKDYFATGQRGADGLWRPRQQASCARPPIRKTRPTQTSSIALSAPSRHTQVPSRPKDATWPRRHGKCFHFRHGREGLADRLTVGLVRGGSLGGPGATPPGAHNPGTRISIACSPDSGFAHTGHGSLHVDFKANTEAWRSFRGAGLLQTACIAHAAVGKKPTHPP